MTVVSKFAANSTSLSQLSGQDHRFSDSSLRSAVPLVHAGTAELRNCNSPIKSVGFVPSAESSLWEAISRSGDLENHRAGVMVIPCS